jgi:hypothetical protein
MNAIKNNNGFMYAATCKEPYLHSAIYSAESLKDYYPEANITLYTEERWLPFANNSGVFDSIITDCPYNIRTKLYMLAKTPYDKTFYIDADTEIMHKDISLIFDQLSNDADVCVTQIRKYAGAEVFLTKEKNDNERMTHHCGLFGYWKKPHILNFMDAWYKQFKYQLTNEFTLKYPEYLTSVKQWDQFAWWFLLNIKNHNLKIDIMEDDARWNFVNTYKKTESKSDIVIMHHTLNKEWINGQDNN